jgi:hypothetical protein
MENQNILEATKLETLSTKYQTIKSSTLVAQLENKGFKLDDVIKLKTRDIKRNGKQKHRMLFSNPKLLSTNHSDGKLQLLVTNSYDGTSGIIFQLGFFRYVCSNGLIGGTSFETISVRHIGINIQEKIDNAVVEIAAQATKLNSLIDKMKNTRLSLGQVIELEKNALKLRTDKNVIIVNIPVLRQADQGNDLFTVYNRVQEAVIRGNAQVTARELKDDKEQVTTFKLRAIKSIASTTQVNRGLFDLVENLITA